MRTSGPSRAQSALATSELAYPAIAHEGTARNRRASRGAVRDEPEVQDLRAGHTKRLRVGAHCRLPRDMGWRARLWGRLRSLLAASAQPTCPSVWQGLT